MKDEFNDLLIYIYKKLCIGVYELYSYCIVIRCISHVLNNFIV